MIVLLSTTARSLIPKSIVSIESGSSRVVRAFSSSTSLGVGSISTSVPKSYPTRVNFPPSYSKKNSTTISRSLATMPVSSEEYDDEDHITDVPFELSEDERYLFDLNGFLIVRNVLTPEEVAHCNAVIDRRQAEIIDRSAKALRNAVPNTAFYGTGPPRKDLGGVLEWGTDESHVFKSILAHPKLVPRFHGLLGKGYRMDHMPFVIANEKGGEGFQLHGGTVDCGSGEYNHHLAYTCHHGTIRSALMGCNVMLVDHKSGDGGFCVVPGSHKSNFKMPTGMMDGERYQEYIIQPSTKAGDVVLFSEGTVHGAMSWKADYQRRVCLFRFAPATNGYGRSYFRHDENAGKGWPKEMYEDMNEAQRAVLEPPYANRLDRPNIEKDGSVTMTTRNERKKQHDKDVFKTKYF